MNEDEFRQVQKALGTLFRVRDHFDHEAAMNAALHMSDTVRPAPLAAAVGRAVADLEQMVVSDDPDDVITRFIAAAKLDMLMRMHDGERRGWGNSWQTDYTDGEVGERIARALQHLTAALVRYRFGEVGIDELRKRAADVANQAFMLADPVRLLTSSEISDE